MGLFSPITIGANGGSGGLALKNRVVMAPLSGNQAEIDGRLGPVVADFYARRARGGVGLIVTEALWVNAVSSTVRRYTSFHTDEMIPGLRAVVDGIHAAGAIVFGQLSCAPPSSLPPAELSAEQIRELRDAFLAGAVRARKAGCDGIELHLAHSSGLADFISRAVNRRSDDYGQRVAGRARLPLEIIAGIRDLFGPNFPISCRFSADECMIGGNTLKETVPLARMLVDAGADMLSVSAGGRAKQGGEYSYLRAFPMHDWPDGMNAYLAEEIKRSVSVPVVVAGKIGAPQVAEAILERGQADMVALGRALLADPEWANKVREGRSPEIDNCVYCRYCRERTDKGELIRCVKTPVE